MGNGRRRADFGGGVGGRIAPWDLGETSSSTLGSFSQGQCRIDPASEMGKSSKSVESIRPTGLYESMLGKAFDLLRVNPKGGKEKVVRGKR